MLKKLIIAAFTAILILSLSGCNSDKTAPEPLSFSGTWESDAPKMSAIVTNGIIEINWTGSAGDSALYWKGSFPDSARENQVFVSNGDVETMSKALLASQGTTKQFKYSGGRLNFNLEILGTTSAVHLER